MNNSAPGTTFFSGLCLLCNFPPGFGEFTCLGSSSTFCFCFMLRRGSGFGFLDSHFRAAGEGWSWRGAHVWRGVVDYIGFPASGMIPENGSWTNIYSVADLAVFFWFPSVDSSLVRFFFPAIFIFLDRMLLSSQQEQYLTLKHVKLLPRLLAASCIPRFWDVEGSIMTWKSHQRASKLVIAN